MEQLQTTIGTVSKQILQNFTKKVRADGIKFWDLRENIEWQHNLVLEAYGDQMLCPEAYSTVFKVLIEIYIAENREQAEEFLSEIEPYYTVSELTAWLHSSDKNIEYVNAALQNSQSRDSIEIFAEAHKLFLQEVGQKLINAISESIAKGLQIYEKSMS